MNAIFRFRSTGIFFALAIICRPNEPRATDLDYRGVLLQVLSGNPCSEGSYEVTESALEIRHQKKVVEER